MQPGDNRENRNIKKKVDVFNPESVDFHKNNRHNLTEPLTKPKHHIDPQQGSIDRHNREKSRQSESEDHLSQSPVKKIDNNEKKEDNLNYLSRIKLKELIRDNELDIIVYKRDSDDNIRDKIREYSDNDHEIETDVADRRLTLLSKDEIRSYIFGTYEKNPEKSLDEIAKEFEKGNFRDENGAILTVNIIRGYRKNYLFYKQKKAMIDERVSDYKQFRQDLDVAEEELEILSQDDDDNPQYERGNERMNQDTNNQSQDPGWNPHGQSPEPRDSPPQVQQPAQQDAAPQVQQPAQQASPPPQAQPPQSPGQEYANQEQAIKEEEKKEKEEPFIIPRKKSKLEILIENFDKAVEERNRDKAGLFLDGIDKEINRDDSGLSGNPWIDKIMTTLIEDKLTNKSGEDIDKMFDRYAKLSGIIKAEIPTPPEGQGFSENVEMARVIKDGITTVGTDIKETILKVTQSDEDIADQFAICPNCKKTVPADSALCSYCGVHFEQKQSPSEGQQQQLPPPQQQHYQPYPPQQQYYAPPPGHQGYPPPPVAEAEPAKTSKERGEHPQPQHNPPPDTTPEQPHVEGVQKPVKITEKERKNVLKYTKKIANYILKKKNPKKAMKTAWSWTDDEEKEWFCLMHVLGSETIVGIAQILEPQFPELKDYLPHLSSPQGQEWINEALESIDGLAQKTKFDIEPERLRELLLRFENRIGFPIHTDK